ncbi:MAG: hypothetical protein QG606_555 [Patescibacteria group bacterium]|nr:hypothetical protein [Patescibacteria group bacterium]
MTTQFFTLFLRQDKFLLFISSWIVYGTVLAIYTFVPYYSNLLTLSVPLIHLSPHELLFSLLCCYTLVLLLIKIPTGSFKRSRISLTMRAIFKITNSFFAGTFSPSLTTEEKVSALLFLVKFFFVPLMLKFLIQNISNMILFFQTIAAAHQIATPEFIFITLYPFALSMLLCIDTEYFLVGYLTESRVLSNEVRSVDTSTLGWLSALACYPPLNEITRTFIGWHSSDFSNFGNLSLNLFFGGLSLICMSVYVWATLSLGWKASNLTNRGIVSRGAYSFVRHPAYISKNLAWWIMGIPFILNAFSQGIFSNELKFANNLISLAPILSIMAWSSIYYIRAITEERHLALDPEYRVYMQKVRYRFLPGIY